MVRATVLSTMSVSKIISLVLLCAVLQQCNSVNEVCTFWKGVYYPSSWRSLVFDRHSFQDSKLLFAACGLSAHDKTCSLVRDKDKPLQKGNYTCNIGLKSNIRGGVLGEHFRVVPFGDERAILAWLERTNTETRLGFTSVRFSDCSRHEVRVNVDHSFDDRLVLDNIHLLAYQNIYDVLYASTPQCGDNYCKLSVDVGTNRVSEPTAWFPLDRNNHIVDVKTLDSADKGVVAIATNNNEQRFFLLRGNDTKILKVYRAYVSASVASSTSNDLIATCHLSSSSLNCVQYDQSGSPIVDSTNQLQGNPRVLAIHNLRGGAGLLVLLNDQADDRIYVVRLDMRGKPVGRIEISHFQCDQNQNALAGNFWEKDEQYCASLACYENDEASARKSDRGHLSATAECFHLRSLQTVS